MNLNDKSWGEFIIGELFDEIINSKAYHKNQLISSKQSKFPYISRTCNNNGLEMLIDESNFVKNPRNTIVFGAESAIFFYEPFEYITGNKMYYIKDRHFNKYVCLFLVTILNNNIGKKFGYSRGLTASRLKEEIIKLPITDNNEPDYEFMEEYIKDKYIVSQQKISKMLDDKLKQLEHIDLVELREKEWGKFSIHDIFDNIQRGKRLTRVKFIYGETPFISSSAVNNGIDSFIANTDKVRIFNNCLTLANSGSVGSTFYHPYTFVASDHVTHLKNPIFSKYVYLFIATMMKRLSEKYNFNREISDKRLKRETIILPITDGGSPDYEYMGQYMKNLEIKVLNKYIRFIGDNDKENLYRDSFKKDAQDKESYINLSDGLGELDIASDEYTITSSEESESHIRRMTRGFLNRLL